MDDEQYGLTTVQCTDGCQYYN